MTAPTLFLDNVTKIHQDGPNHIHALDSVTLEVMPGELVAIMGASGSGKSTLLNVSGTLTTPTSGRVLLGGADTSEMSPNKIAALRRQFIGFVFQDFNLLPTLTATENIALPLELDGMNTRNARAAALHTLEELGLTELSDRFPSEMSGGQRQRIAIARAVVGKRQLLLADEPTGALDSTTADDVLELLVSRVRAGAAGLLVTHEPRLAAYADRTIYLRDGHIHGGAK
ncbi:ABC transporter ATP-binding protein [Corynebacterium hindlerae]|uniref:ABC transporter ATP-binding protein n=1 Tax=Corynebacterium hindlerae TaxID=699041 RepID=A0A7G5FE41_9CORY|nr:ABC transporter ATP-binding protein [Corynebacterium hindlerae]QMV84882.1 ABC transporter ATP-binding protein [Corynebacterium hindlerae]